jgi:heme exporter protein D
MKLCHYGDASPFLTMTGMSWQAFLQLLDVLLIDHHHQCKKGGRPLLMDPTAQLGFYLFFVGSTMGIKHLSLIFGVTSSVCSRTITAILLLVVQKLKRHPLARVKFHNVDKMASFARQIQIHEPEVDNVIGFMDSLSLSSECASEMLEQKCEHSLFLALPRLESSPVKLS